VSIPYFFVSEELRQHKYHIVLKDRLLPLLAVVMVACVYLIQIKTDFSFPVSLFAIAGLIILTVVQWRSLNEEVRFRIGKTFSKFNFIRSAR